MAGVWEVLGIEATSDEALIRKAYAARLRENHPDSNPSGFKMLRAAYEAALSRRSRPVRPQNIPQAIVQADNSLPVVEQEIQPPTPEEVERIEILRGIADALNEKRLSDAVTLYDRGLAGGVLEFGRRELVLDQILLLAVNDKSLSAKDFLALLQHVGWQSGPRRNDWYSPARHACAARVEAEAWLFNLERVAYREDVPNWKRSYKPVIVIVRALHRWREWKNANLLLGATQFFRVSEASVQSLQTLMLQYEHYKPWIAHRMDPHANARAQGILRRDGMFLGPTRKWLWPVLAILLGLNFGLAALALAAALNPASLFSGIISYRLLRYGIFRVKNK
jgi:hypothetical protein